MKPAQILRLLFVSLILIMAISVNQSANGETSYFNDILKSAEQGDPDAQYNLGSMFYVGQGVPQDYIQAVKWYTKAAEQGNADAQYSLGLMCTAGTGVTKNYVQAYKWFILAAAQGDPEAIKPGDSLKQRMTTDQIAEAQKLAREFRLRTSTYFNGILKSAQSGDPNAQVRLAQYTTGVMALFRIILRRLTGTEKPPNRVMQVRNTILV